MLIYCNQLNLGKIVKLLLLLLTALFITDAHAFFWNREDLSLKEETVRHWQPATDEKFVIPERPYDLWHYDRNMRGSGLNFFERAIPTYEKKGTLFSSWTPSGQSNSPTMIIVHGGHGITPSELSAGMWFRKNLNANILILDSFWSRGRFENHESTNQFGVDMRVLDVIAARQWLESNTNIDQNLELGVINFYLPRQLRKNINDNIQDNNQEILNDFKHSPIIGWAYDGNPIYGPYGYTSLTDKTVKLISSSYNKKSTSSSSLRPSFFINGFFVQDYQYNELITNVLNKNFFLDNRNYKKLTPLKELL